MNVIVSQQKLGQWPNTLFRVLCEKIGVMLVTLKDYMKTNMDLYKRLVHSRYSIIGYFHYSVVFFAFVIDVFIGRDTEYGRVTRN